MILDTHCHADHITAAWFLKQKTKASICISKASGVSGADRNLQDGDIVRFGDRFLRVLATPGHTAGCLTYLLDDSSMAFTGDALLIRGCGRTDFQEGDPNVLYQSINEKIFTLPDDTRLFPGHDYIENNIAFTLDREPDNETAKSLREQFKGELDAESFVSDIGLEREINVFFRLASPQVRDGIASSFKLDVNDLDDEKTFIGLRGLRDNW